MATSRLSFRTITRFRCIQSHISYPRFQSKYFATKQRPKSIVSLSNPNRRRTQDNKDTTDSSDDNTNLPTDWNHYDIQLFQYYHDPRSSQFRVLLDYFKIEYDCVEVTPFKKMELSMFQIPEKYHHAPLLRMGHQAKIKNTIDSFKKQAIQYIPNGFRHEAMQIGNVGTFRQRIKEHIKKQEGKTAEQMDEYIEKVDELFEHYDGICHDRYNLYFHHNDLYSKFLPLLESNMSNDQRRRFFNDKCDSDKVEFYASKYAWTLQACIVKSIHSCFQLMSYVRMFKKLRNWSRFMTERTHLLAAFKMRIFHKRKYCKRAQTGNQPKGQAMKLTYEFLQTFNADMADLTKAGKIPKQKDDSEISEEDNSLADITLIGKPFHGGRSPDILDLLVYGAVRGTQGLDVHNFLFRKTTQIHDWYTKMQDEVGTSACKKHM